MSAWIRKKIRPYADMATTVLFPGGSAGPRSPGASSAKVPYIH